MIVSLWALTKDYWTVASLILSTCQDGLYKGVGRRKQLLKDFGVLTCSESVSGDRNSVWFQFAGFTNETYKTFLSGPFGLFLVYAP